LDRGRIILWFDECLGAVVMLAKTSALRSSCQCLLPAALISLVFFVPGRSAADQPAKQPAAAAAMGELKIEGKFIEGITLERESGGRTFDPNNTIVLGRPGPSVSLPAGTYRLRGIDLQGGYTCSPPMAVVKDGIRYESSFVLAADSPHVLRIGAPLNPTVTAYRDGPRIRFAYSLTDGAEERRYYKSVGGEPPRFAILQGDHVVGTGTFEYG
jgi:hypothetical protein